MTSLKKYLKAAKSAIEQNDPESALEYVEEALEIDKDNYFCYIFQGKSYQLLNNIDQAIESFEKATRLDEENLLGWKGYFQVVRCQTNYHLFFTVLIKYIEKQVCQGIGIGDTLKDFRNYLDRNKYKSNPDLYEFYLRSVIPGSNLGDLVGTSFGKPEDNLKNLIDLIKKKEDDLVSKLIAKEKMKLPRNLSQEQKNYLNNIAWTIYRDSELSSLFEAFLNICNDDELRRKYEEEYLKCKYELLKVIPEKSALFEEIKEMVDGMILVKTESLFCWNLYFDWIDVKNLGDLEEDKIIYFLRNFQDEGLGKVLYSFLMSDISPFNKSQIVKEISSTKDSNQNKDVVDNERFEIEDEHEAQVLDKIKQTEEEDISEQNLLPEQILTLMLEGFSKCSDSVLANRIICSYYIHLREYVEGLDRCREAIRILANLQRSLGIDLENTREDLLCSLAIIYTYYEAPKNFPRALQLYDRILENNTNNLKARIGKGLILIEKNDLILAKKLLEEVVNEYPGNNQALYECSWCEIKLGNYSTGRNGLLRALNDVKGMDLHSGETRAIIHWRIAKSYLLDNKDDSDNVNEAYSHLINSLKDSKNYAPSYTLLGVLYQDYYNDKARAQKCFYKAFELDVAEIIAAKYLVEDLTAKNDWDIGEILCKRIVTSERSRRMLFSQSFEDDDRSWPYRVLGCSALNQQDDAKAIEWFQTALRMTSMDIECWTGLGEAYYNCGRYDAAAKVFRHVLTMDEDSWVVKYMLGLVICDMGEFEEGLEFLNESLIIRPDEECVLNALYKAYIDNASRLVAGGFFGRAIESNINAIELIAVTSQSNKNSQSLWKSLGESLRIALIIQERIESLPIDCLITIFKSIGFNSNPNNPFMQELNDLDSDSNQEVALDLFKSEEYVESISIFIILAAKAAIQVLPNKTSNSLRSITYYNLGLAFLESFNLTENDKYRDLSIRTLKKAIQFEPNNSSFWVALGNAYVSSNPQISQHCFIKAISLESRDADIWSNLAALYLRYGDIELAQEAFLRAQSIAPQQSQPWLGHAMAAHVVGDNSKASGLFTHALVLSNGRSPLAQLLYGLSIIDKRIGTPGNDPRDIEAAQEFSVANFAMMNYLKFAPNDEIGLKVALTISERCKNYESGIKVGERLCFVLEKKYEKNESESTLIEYVKAKTQLSRIYLGLSNYEKALETAQFAIDILGEDAEDNPEYVSIILSSRIIIGLSFFFNDGFDEALENLKLILAKHSDSKRLITLTAQILYAYGTQETKQASLDQLFAFIEEHGSSLIVVLTLGAISIVDSLDEYFSAIKEELEGLSLDELIGDSFRTVPKILNQINKRLHIVNQDKIWQRNSILFPSDYNIWEQLNSQMALHVASLKDTKLIASDLSKAYMANRRLREIQRSIILSPDNEEATKALQGCF